MTFEAKRHLIIDPETIRKHLWMVGGTGSGKSTYAKNVIHSLLVVGGTGSGKTTTLKVFAFQQRVNPDEPRVVFDYKEDWKRFFGG